MKAIILIILTSFIRANDLYCQDTNQQLDFEIKANQNFVIDTTILKTDSVYKIIRYYKNFYPSKVLYKGKERKMNNRKDSLMLLKLHYHWNDSSEFLCYEVKYLNDSIIKSKCYFPRKVFYKKIIKKDDIISEYFILDDNYIELFFPSGTKNVMIKDY